RVVGVPRAAGRGVDPGDPELAHVALARPPVAICIFERVQQGFVGRTEQRSVRHPEALGQIQDLLVAAAGRDTALDAWHLSPSPSYKGQPAADAGRLFPSG